MPLDNIWRRRILLKLIIDVSEREKKNEKTARTNINTIWGIDNMGSILLIYAKLAVYLFLAIL